MLKQKDCFEITLITSKRKQTSFETEEKNFITVFFKTSKQTNDIKQYSRNTFLGAVFSERLNRTIRYLLEKPVFQKVMVIG